MRFGVTIQSDTACIECSILSLMTTIRQLHDCTLRNEMIETLGKQTEILAMAIENTIT